MGTGAIIAAAVATTIIQHNLAEERRRQAERRRREEEERQRRYREEERRREERDRQRREEERRRKEADARRRRFNNKFKSDEQISVDGENVASVEFTDKLHVGSEFFPSIVAETEFETKYADGSYATSDSETVEKNSDGRHTEYKYHTLCLHLPNGVTRTYAYSEYSRGEGYHLIREELPDGRMKRYDYDQNLIFERDVNGQYKCYKSLRDHKTFMVSEEGSFDGWSKRFDYDEKYQDGKSVGVDVKERKNEYLSNKKGIEFTDKLCVPADFFAAAIAETEFETKYADGSYATFDSETVGKNSGGRHTEYKYRTLCLHLPNGVTRTYAYSDYSRGEGYHLIREELPDGRMKRYDYDQNLIYEREANGQYKIYKHLRDEKTFMLSEEGSSDGWSKRYDYDERYQDGKYVITEVKETLADGSYRIFDEKEKFVKEERDADGHVRKWSERGKLLEDQLADGTIYRWNEFEVMTFEKLPNGEETHWNNQGIKTYEKFESGEMREWTDKGVLIYEKLAASEERRWNEQNVLVYEKTAEGEIREWTDKGHKVRERFADGRETRWFADTDKVSYQREKDGSYKEFDELGRVVREETASDTSYAYRYYGDTEQLLDKRTITGYGKETEYEHYDKKGKVDTEHYKALKKIAKERMQKEDEISKKKGKKTILPKMSTIKKAVVYRQKLRQVEKEK